MLTAGRLLLFCRLAYKRAVLNNKSMMSPHLDPTPPSPSSTGSFFLSLTENLQHVLSLKLYFYGHNVTFQVTIECYTNQFIDRHFDLKNGVFISRDIGVLYLRHLQRTLLPH